MSLDESRFGTHTWDGLRLKKDQHHLVPMDLNSWPILPKHSARLFFPFPQLLSCASWPAFGATPHLQAHHGPSGMVAANRVDALDLQGNWLDSAGHSIFVSHWATLRTWDDLGWPGSGGLFFVAFEDLWSKSFRDAVWVIGFNLFRFNNSAGVFFTFKVSIVSVPELVEGKTYGRSGKPWFPVDVISHRSVLCRTIQGVDEALDGHLEGELPLYSFKTFEWLIASSSSL